MAKVCELVSIKFNMIFGDTEIRNQHKFLLEKIYPSLGLDGKNGITIKEVIRLRDYLVELSPKCRIIGLEENDGCEIIYTEVWESYGDSYDPYWIENTATKFNPDSQLNVYVKLPNSIWNHE